MLVTKYRTIATVSALAAALTICPGALAGPPTFERTFAGPGRADMYPVDVAMSDTHLFVLDPGRYRVVKVARSSGDIVDSFGGHRGRSQSRIGAARAIARDDAGAIYVADTANNRIVKLSNDLAWVRSWGTLGAGNGQFVQDYGVAVGDLADGTDVIYVVDGANGGRVQAFDSDGQWMRTFGGSHITKPRHLTVDPRNGWIHVIDAEVKRIVVFDRTGTFRYAYGNGQGGGPGEFRKDPRGLEITSDGRAFVSDPGNSRVQVWEAGDESASYECSIGTAGTGPSDFEDIRGITLSSGGATLAVTDEWDFSVKEYSLDGPNCPDTTFRRELFGGRAPVGGFNSPRGLAVSPNGRVFGVDWWNQRIQRFDPGGNVRAWGKRGIRKELGTLNFPWDVAIQPGTGRLFVANRESHEIEVFKQDGTPITDWGTGGAARGQFRFPQGLAFTPSGSKLWITDSGNNRLQRCAIQPSGEGVKCVIVGGPGEARGRFATPTGIAVAESGAIWVADTRNDRIQKRRRGGGWVAFDQPSGTGTSAFRLPWGVSVGPDGDVWVADSANHRIVRLNPNGTEAYAFTGPAMGAGPFDFPFDVAIAGGKILISDTWNNRIVQGRL
jgi:tripartite motif-containing protein 71